MHNQNGHVRENLLKEVKSDSSLQDCLCVAKTTEGTVHVEKLGQNFLANVEKHDQNVDAVNHGRQQFKKQTGSKFRQQSHSHSKEVPKITKVVRNVVTVELIIHLVNVQHMEKTASSARRKDISVHTADLARTANTRGPRCQHEVEQDDNGDDWTFSLNQDEVIIKFTNSVTKVKGSKNVMFDEIELSRVLVDFKVQAALKPNENCAPVPNNGCPLHKLRFKLDSGAHGNLMQISMCKSLFPGLPHNELRKSINKRVILVAYNKQEIK